MKQIYLLRVCAVVRDDLAAGCGGLVAARGAVDQGRRHGAAILLWSVWAVAVSQAMLMAVWKMLPADADGERGQAGCVCGGAWADGAGGVSWGAAADAADRAGGVDGRGLSLDLAL